MIIMRVKGKLIVLTLLFLMLQYSLLTQGYIELNASVKINDFYPSEAYVSPQQNLYLIGMSINDEITPTIYTIEQNGTISNVCNITYITPLYYYFKYVLIDDVFLAYMIFGGIISIYQYNTDFELVQSYNFSISNLPCSSGFSYCQITEQGNLYLFFADSLSSSYGFTFHVYKLNLDCEIIWHLNYNVTLDESFNSNLAFQYFKYSIQEPYIATAFWKDLTLIDASNGKILWQKKLDDQILSVAETAYGPIIGYEAEVNNETRVTITSFTNAGLKLWTRYLTPKVYLQLQDLEFFVKQNTVAVRQRLLMAEELQTVRVDYFELFNEEGASLGSISKYVDTHHDNMFFLVSNQVCGVAHISSEGENLGNLYVETEIELYSFAATKPFGISNYVAIAVGSIILIGISVLGAKTLIRRKT
ncbi:MAG: hypothetical protein ACTSYD_04260 [Candidatus Heimdallarchaeaceae archaeon]